MALVVLLTFPLMILAQFLGWVAYLVSGATVRGWADMKELMEENTDV